MSTYYQEMKEKRPVLAAAYAIVGAGSPKWALRNMVKALSMCPALNTEEDTKRLNAALFILKNEKAGEK